MLAAEGNQQSNDGVIADERAQSRVRMFVSGTLLLLIPLLALLSALNPISAYDYLAPMVLVHTTLATALWLATLRARCTSPARRMVGNGLDYAFATLALIQMGAVAALIWLIYLWIVLGNGMRYGVRYLVSMTALALAASSVLYLSDNFWREHWELTLSLQGGLLLVPFFYSGVIGKVHAEHEALRDHAAAVSASAEAKAQFLANMSHELRTPMNGILGVAQLLAPRLKDAENQELIELLKRSARALVAVIDDVLDFSKLEAQRLQLEARPVDLRQLASDVAELFRAQAEAKGLTLSASFAGDGHFVLGDDTRMRQIFSNLVSNAVKFTDAGSVTVAVTADCLAEDDRVALCLAVQDTGIGMSAEEQERVFEHFEQADRSTTRRFGGTGLGLAISRQLAELMGGAIDLESAPGTGSTFRFRAVLPVAQAPQTDTARPAGGFRGDALVAEDNPVNQLVARKLLEALGLEVTVVDDGAAAVAAAADHPYDVVFMDLHMPVMGGREAAERICVAQPASALVALTADVSALAADADGSPFDAVLAKPVDRQALTATLERVLTGEGRRAAATSVAQGLTGAGGLTG